MYAEFSENLITGNEMIDSQHKELIEKMNQLLERDVYKRQVTTIFINASFAASPAAMPIMTPSISLAGRLFMILFIDVSPISLFILQSSS